VSRRTPSALRLAAVVAVTALLAACATADGRAAGERVTPTASSDASSDLSPAASAPAELVAAADLADCPASDPAVDARDDGLPDVTLPCLGVGPAVRLAGLRGTPTVVNVWASWCGPCREELALVADLAGASGTGLRVIGIDATDDPPSALSLLADAGAHYPSVRDDAGATKAALRWGPGLPVTYLVDADGRIAYEHHGAITSAEQLRTLLADHLGVAVPS
jgi:thiol-disulfide isomerase/thioredoxin